MPDEGQSCTSKLRVIPGALYPVFVERTASDKWAADYYVLPSGAEKDGFVWRLSNGNVIDKEVRLVGLFNGVEAEFDLTKTGIENGARSPWRCDRARRTRLDVSLCDLAYEFGVEERTNDRGLSYYTPTFCFIGAKGVAGRAHRGGDP